MKMLKKSSIVIALLMVAAGAQAQVGVLQGTVSGVNAGTVLPVFKGTSVDFTNDDWVTHNVFSKSGPGEFDLGLYGRGESKGSRFEPFFTETLAAGSESLTFASPATIST